MRREENTIPSKWDDHRGRGLVAACAMNDTWLYLELGGSFRGQEILHSTMYQRMRADSQASRDAHFPGISWTR